MCPCSYLTWVWCTQNVVCSGISWVPYSHFKIPQSVGCHIKKYQMITVRKALHWLPIKEKHWILTWKGLYWKRIQKDTAKKTQNLLRNYGDGIIHSRLLFCLLLWKDISNVFRYAILKETCECSSKWDLIYATQIGTCECPSDGELIYHTLKGVYKCHSKWDLMYPTLIGTWAMSL